MTRIVLASGSPYRRALLARLCLPFDWQAPDLDERQRPGETPRALVCRLAVEKAARVAAGCGTALVIGSDQIAVLDGEILGKPGDLPAARAQLTRASGRELLFLTGLCVLDTGAARHLVDCVPFRVRFRRLSAAQIARYLALEAPYDCAGSFKAEGLGIALFQGLYGSDPTALTGLPLIRLTSMLGLFGLPVLERAAPSAGAPATG